MGEHAPKRFKIEVGRILLQEQESQEKHSTTPDLLQFHSLNKEKNLGSKFDAVVVVEWTPKVVVDAFPSTPTQDVSISINLCPVRISYHYLGFLHHWLRSKSHFSLIQYFHETEQSTSRNDDDSTSDILTRSSAASLEYADCSCWKLRVQCTQVDVHLTVAGSKKLIEAEGKGADDINLSARVTKFDLNFDSRENEWKMFAQQMKLTERHPTSDVFFPEIEFAGKHQTADDEDHSNQVAVVISTGITKTSSFLKTCSTNKGSKTPESRPYFRVELDQRTDGDDTCGGNTLSCMVSHCYLAK